MMRRYRSEIVVSLLLLVSTLGVYWQVQDHQFVNYDDDDYVTENRDVQAGWTWEGVVWAFTTRLHGHWHPLTWLSHMTDCQLFGLNPAGHHLTSLFLHVANTMLLFLVLRWMTGALFRSAFVAGLFALHPLHVESVAWVADRKDVLSTFFWMITMAAYVGYCEHPGLKRYVLVCVAYILGLMAKPMVVTLPFVLLLIDYWPLNRMRFAQQGKKRNQETTRVLHARWKNAPVPHLVGEKVPLFIITGASVVVALLTRQHGRAFGAAISKLWTSVEHIANALVCYISYLGKMFWPVNLATPYPRPGEFPVWQIGGAALLVVCISFLVFWKGRRHPYLPVGWLWYIVTLMPVIGVVRVGPHIMADRYTYVPLIGLFIMIAWGFPDLLSRWPYRNVVLATSSAVVLSILVTLSWLQVRHWETSITLCKHTLEVTSNNVRAHNNLANALADQGRLSEAVFHYSEALRMKPDSAKLHYNLGIVMLKLKRLDEAAAHFMGALQISPNSAEAHNNLGTALLRQGRLKEAAEHCGEALRLRPILTEAQDNLQLTLRLKGESPLASQAVSDP